jgi:anti-anti-sigma factor
MVLIEQSEATGGIDVVTGKGRTLVRMWGDVDGSLRDEASTSMSLVLMASAPVLIDAAGVTFIDSSGLAFILQLHLAAAESGQRVVLRDPNHAITDLLAMIGMADAVLLEGDVPTDVTAP